MYKYTSAIGSIEMSITKIKNFRINPVSKKRISVLISNIRERYHENKDKGKREFILKISLLITYSFIICEICSI